MNRAYLLKFRESLSKFKFNVYSFIQSIAFLHLVNFKIAKFK